MKQEAAHLNCWSFYCFSSANHEAAYLISDEQTVFSCMTRQPSGKTNKESGWPLCYEIWFCRLQTRNSWCEKLELWDGLTQCIQSGNIKKRLLAKVRIWKKLIDTLRITVWRWVNVAEVHSAEIQRCVANQFQIHRGVPLCLEIFSTTLIIFEDEVCCLAPIPIAMGGKEKHGCNLRIPKVSKKTSFKRVRPSVWLSWNTDTS